MNIKNLFNNDFKNIIFIVLLTFFSFLLLHNICDSSIFDHTLWDSYELQADSWLNGRLDVDNNEGLELAIYKGKYYVSFPPLPSLIVLPFVLVFGVYNTPSNFIIFMIILINIIVAYKILRKHGTNEFNSILLSIGLLLGSNMLSLSMNGGV